MKSTQIISIIFVILFTIITVLSIACAGENKIIIRSFQEEFDFYITSEKSKLFDCDINGVEHKYNEAIPVGRKPANANAVYIGRGKINLKKIIEEEKDLEQSRITLFNFINIELERNLSRGIDTIQNMLISTQDDLCADGSYFRNSYFKNMVSNLIKKIKTEFKKNGNTKDVIRGQELLKKLQCSE
jgi:hypothetical protein